MNFKDKNDYKLDFKKNLDKLSEKLQNYVASENGDWTIKGFIDLKNENGVFSRLGEKWFDEYWMNYGIATMIKKGKTIKITNIKDFLEFKGRNDLLNKVVENKY